jgi:Na+/H+ antiporter NhaD/arsenite permease-like protein
MVVTRVLTQDDVYEILGHRDNLRTIFLLLGMMLLSQYFEREELIKNFLHLILRQGISFWNMLWRISLITFIVSALFTNDAACIILTPLILKYWSDQNRHCEELETLLLTIATSANIGSVVTIFGNPQLALIASRTDTPLFNSSVLDLKRCLVYLGIPALLAYFLNIGFLFLHFKISKSRGRKSNPDQNTGYLFDGEKSILPLETINDVDNLKFKGISHINETEEYHVNGSPHGMRGLNGNNFSDSDNHPFKGVLVGELKENQQGILSVMDAICNDNEQELHSSLTLPTNKLLEISKKDRSQSFEWNRQEKEFSASGSRIFHVGLVLLLVLVISLFFASTPSVKFDMGMSNTQVKPGEVQFIPIGV